MKDHYSPKFLTIAERFKLNKRDQREGETISQYLVELKKLAATCEYGDFLEQALRDRLVCGIRDQQIQRKLLSVSALTLQKAVEIAVAMELATKQSKQFQDQPSGGTQAQSQQVNKVKARRPYSQNKGVDKG